MTCCILQSDAAHLPLADASVQCVVTSPPYWGLRDYGTATWAGGDAECDHIDPAGPVNAPSGKSTLTTNNGNGPLPGDKYQADRKAQYRNTCGKCGARRIDLGIGLEPTLDEYLRRMVAVFQEVKRVLRDDGTLWLNMGDAYWGGKGENGSSKARATAMERGYVQSGGTVQMSKRPSDGRHETIKPKDLIGQPWRLAFALQADGWYLRSDIIWHKPNPMPESVTDRPTKSHEYLFLLTKAAKYFYDAEAVKEASETMSANGWGPRGDAARDADKRTDLPTGFIPTGTRNLRTVWTIPTHAFAEAHFATFPPKLVEPCIRAGTSERGCCPKCAAPWKRVVERTDNPAASHNGSRFDVGKTAARDGGDRTQAGERFESVTTGWQPTCKCDAGEPVPCIVFDPFCGAGTTGLVARRLGRRFVGTELNATYIAMARKRIHADAPLFNAV